MHFSKHGFLSKALLSSFLLAAALAGCQSATPTPIPEASPTDTLAAVTIYPTVTPETSASPIPSANAFTFLWAGDTLLDDAAQPLLDEHGYLYPFEYLEGYLEADCSILNLEGPITTLTEPWDPSQRWSYNANPLSAEALASLGFDAVSLANNHSLDRGSQGILDTVANLQNNGMIAFGAGMNLQQARKPVFIQTIYGKVAVIAFSQKYTDKRTAKSNHPGNFILSADNIRESYENARSNGAAWIVAFVHWGENYANINADQERWAQEFAYMGYDLVIGHHPHMVQPVDFIGKTPIVFSVGNFVFGSKGRFTEEFPGYGLLVKSELTDQGFTRLLFTCLQTDNDVVNYQPRPCTPQQSAALLKQLHPRMELLDDGTGVLNLK